MEFLNKVERKVLPDGSLGLPVRTYTVDILTNPPNVEIVLGDWSCQQMKR